MNRPALFRANVPRPPLTRVRIPELRLRKLSTGIGVAAAAVGAQIIACRAAQRRVHRTRNGCSNFNGRATAWRLVLISKQELAARRERIGEELHGEIGVESQIKYCLTAIGPLVGFLYCSCLQQYVEAESRQPLTLRLTVELRPGDSARGLEESGLRCFFRQFEWKQPESPKITAVERNVMEFGGSSCLSVATTPPMIARHGAWAAMRT